MTLFQSFLTHVTVTQPSNYHSNVSNVFVFLESGLFHFHVCYLSAGLPILHSDEEQQPILIGGPGVPGTLQVFAPSIRTTTLRCCSVTPNPQTRKQTISRQVSRPSSSVPPVRSFPDNLKDVLKHFSDQVPVLPQALTGFLLALWVKRERY